MRSRARDSGTPHPQFRNVASAVSQSISNGLSPTFSTRNLKLAEPTQSSLQNFKRRTSPYKRKDCTKEAPKNVSLFMIELLLNYDATSLPFNTSSHALRQRTIRCLFPLRSTTLVYDQMLPCIPLLSIALHKLWLACKLPSSPRCIIWLNIILDTVIKLIIRWGRNKRNRPCVPRSAQCGH